MIVPHDKVLIHRITIIAQVAYFKTTDLLSFLFKLHSQGSKPQKTVYLLLNVVIAIHYLMFVAGP